MREIEFGQSFPYPGERTMHPDSFGRCRCMLIWYLGSRPRTGIQNRPTIGRVLACLPLVPNRSVSSRLLSVHRSDKNDPGASGRGRCSHRGLVNILSLTTPQPDSTANIISNHPHCKFLLQIFTTVKCQKPTEKILTGFTKFYTSDFITNPILIIRELQTWLCSQRDYWVASVTYMIISDLPP